MESEKKSEPGRFGNVRRYRHEYKYLIDARQSSILMLKAAGLLQRDPYAGPDGTYLIRSAYFDDLDGSCLSDNLSGMDPRSKFRLRYYNSDAGRIMLEKKIKKRGMCLKESCGVTPEECTRLLRGEIPEFGPDAPETKQQLFTEIRLRGLRPKTIVTYRRMPFVYSGGNVRVTFDSNITSSPDVERFLSGDYRERPILSDGSSVLEVKWDEVMPRHIRETLQLEKLEWTAFSKFCNCRLLHL